MIGLRTMKNALFLSRLHTIQTCRMAIGITPQNAKSFHGITNALEQHRGVPIHVAADYSEPEIRNLQSQGKQPARVLIGVQCRYGITTGLSENVGMCVNHV